VLTFLAGAELGPSIFRTKWKKASAVGLVGFFAPFLGATAVAHFALGWSVRSIWLAGIALSTTSVAVVYAVMLELGFNQTNFGKGIHDHIPTPAGKGRRALDRPDPATSYTQGGPLYIRSAAWSRL